MGAYTIILKRSAIADLDALRKYDATQIANAMERHLQHDPTKESKSRIKRLRGISNPDYRGGKLEEIFIKLTSDTAA